MVNPKKARAESSKETITVNTQSDVAQVYDMSVAAVAMWVRQGMPGSNGTYELQAISRWLRGPDGPATWRQHAKPDTDDPLLATGDSPGLERYRLAKAAIAELDLDERRGGLIELAKVRIALSRWSTILRRLGERLAKRFGNEAAAALNDTLAECHRAIGYEFSNRPTDETPNGHAKLGAEPSAGSDSSDDEPMDGG